MPSLLENLQRRLDDVPIPDILHRAHSHQPQEPAAGLEASPRLRVRAFPQQPQARQLSAVAPADGPLPMLHVAHPSQQQNTQLSSSWQPRLASRPTWNTHAEPPAIQQGMLASQDWLADLPDTPEAPRAATAAQRQAVVDVLFEAAAGESAVGDSEIVQEDPSWLDDAAAYDAAVAEMDDDDMSALEIFSADDDSPIDAALSQARLNLSSLEQLLQSDNEEEDSCPTSSSTASDRQRTDGQVPITEQISSMVDITLLDSEEEQDSPVRGVSPSRSQQASQNNSNNPLAQGTSPTSSPTEIAIGHNGLPRPVLSDVTSRFPSEQQLSQQLPEDGADKTEGSSFQLQRRGRQPRVCRSLLAGDADSATDAANSSNSQSVSAIIDVPDGQMLRPVLRSSARSQAMQSALHSSEASASTQITRCTRRQTKLSKQSSQQGQISQADLSSDDDFAVVTRSQRNGRLAAVNPASSAQSSLGQVPGHNQLPSSMTHIATGEQAQVGRRNRSRLQLNRSAGRAKDAEGIYDLQAAYGSNAL